MVILHYGYYGNMDWSLVDLCLIAMIFIFIPARMWWPATELLQGVYALLHRNKAMHFHVRIGVAPIYAMFSVQCSMMSKHSVWWSHDEANRSRISISTWKPMWYFYQGSSENNLCPLELKPQIREATISCSPWPPYWWYPKYDQGIYSQLS